MAADIAVAGKVLSMAKAVAAQDWVEGSDWLGCPNCTAHNIADGEGPLPDSKITVRESIVELRDSQSAYSHLIEGTHT
jgi:hypothetical protein